MFVRNVSINLKPNTLTEFTKTMESEIIPLLRKQKGFQDEITLSVPGGREGSGRQGCESSKVKVLVPSIACSRTASISGACRGNEARSARM
jgi:hypothetical protein